MGLESKVVEEISSVDREKTCPLLLRVFCNTTGHHNRASDFSRSKGGPSNELQIYTWMDATLKELARLITEVYPDTKVKGTTFDFSVVYPHPRHNMFTLKDIGRTTLGSKGPDDNVTLQSKRFIIGDYLDVAIIAPRNPGGGGDKLSGRDRDRDRDNRRNYNYR